MSEERLRAEVIRYWWDKAVRSLQAARREAAAGDYAFAVNRAYDTLFYAVSAFLLEERRRFTKHSGVRAAFNRDLIKTKYLSREDGELYNQLFRDRQEGDYSNLRDSMQTMSRRKSMLVLNFSNIFGPCYNLCRKAWRGNSAMRRLRAI